MNADEITAFLAQAFPNTRTPTVVLPEPGVAVLRVTADAGHLRPGGSLSGPTLMTLADTAMYVLVLSHYGFQPMAVTSSLSIDFLRKPPLEGLLAEARFLKAGRTLAVGTVTMRSEGEPSPCAHAVVTYALPASPG
jgi:uncharacterized protein (TIGR00369 family)